MLQHVLKQNRREFLYTSAAALAAARNATSQFVQKRKMIGIQVGAVSFVDEGVDPVLDVLQQKADVNTLFIAVFTYGRGIAGRQVPGQPFPDHGKQQYDTDTFHGGSYAAIHPKYFQNTSLKDIRATDLGKYDVLASVLPASRKRGMQNIAWFEDVFRSDTPGVQQLEEKDLHGRNATTLCFNNPGYRAFLLDLVEDYTRSWDLDGIMWGSERQGAFSNALGASAGGMRTDPGKVTCFCQYCQKKGAERGIQFDRVQKGFGELETFVRAGRQGKQPIDGSYVELWRLMLRYPELLAWENLWHDSLRDTYSAIYHKIKSIKPSMGVGWHIWHTNSFSPIYRAEQDLKQIAPVSDFLKIVIYNNVGGERLASYVDSIDQTEFGGMPKEQLLQFLYQVLGYKNEGTIDRIPHTGLSSDYVYRETKRARAGLNGTKTLLWPGIDIDVPTANGHSKCTPEMTRDAVAAAFKGGADGVILSRKYSEMKLANLAGAGEAIRKLGNV